MKYNRLSSIALAALFCVSQIPTEAYALEDNSKNRATAPYVLSDSDMDRVYAGQIEIIGAGLVIGGIIAGGTYLYLIRNQIREAFQTPRPGLGLPEGISLTNPNPFFNP